MRKTFTLATLATAAAVAVPANAAIIIYDSPGAVQPGENVLFDVDQPFSTTVSATTNQTDTMVNFTSDENLDVTGSQGQARIEGVDGSLDNLTVTLENAMLSFTEFEFNLFNALDNTTEVTITLSDGTVQTFQLNPNGQNYFGIEATDGDSLTSVSFATNGVGVDDVRQVRIGGIGEMTAAVPEPATWALLLLGFGFVGGMMRKTKPAHVRVRYA